MEGVSLGPSQLYPNCSHWFVSGTCLYRPLDNLLAVSVPGSAQQTITIRVHDKTLHLRAFPF